MLKRKSLILIASVLSAGVLVHAGAQAQQYEQGLGSFERMREAERREAIARRQERKLERREQRAAKISRECARRGDSECARRWAKRADRLDDRGDAAQRRERAYDAIGDRARANCRRTGYC